MQNISEDLARQLVALAATHEAETGWLALGVYLVGCGSRPCENRALEHVVVAHEPTRRDAIGVREAMRSVVKDRDRSKPSCPTCSARLRHQMLVSGTIPADHSNAFPEIARRLARDVFNAEYFISSR